jgi:hypothetical protein
MNKIYASKITKDEVRAQQGAFTPRHALSGDGNAYMIEEGKFADQNVYVPVRLLSDREKV